MSSALSDKERFVANAWYLGVAQVVGTGATYASLFVLTRLGVEKYGLWVLALLLGGYLSPWATLGLTDALMRFCPAYPSEGQRVAGYRLACRTSLAFSALVFLGMAVWARPLAAALLGGPEQWGLVVLVGLLFPLEAQFLIGNSYLLARERLGTYALLTSLRYLVEVVVLAGLVHWLPDLGIMLGAKVVILLVLALIQHQKAGRGSGEAAGFAPRVELKRYLQFGFPMVPAIFLWGLIMGMDRFLLEHLGALSVVATYNVADVVALFLLNCTRPINGVLQPRFANLFQDRPEEVQAYLAQALKYLALLLFPGAVGLAVVAGPLVDLASHTGFEAAAEVIPFLAMAYVLIGLSNPLYHLVFLRRGGKVFPGLFGLCLLVNGALNLLLIPAWGGIGAALATLGCFLVYVAGLLCYSETGTLRTLVGQWTVLGTIAGCSALMGLSLLGARTLHPALNSLILVPLGMAVYGVLLKVTRLVSRKELALLLSPVQRLKVMASARCKSARLLSLK